MEVAAILQDLRQPPPFFPSSALRAAAECQQEVTPALLKLVEQVVTSALDQEKNPEEMALLYALFLLAQFREAQAYPLLVRLASLPSPIVESLLGDTLTEDLDALLASVSRGDPSGIKRLIENHDADLWVRTASLRAMLILVKVGEQPREDVLAYFGSLFRGGLKREPSFLWGALISDCLDLYPDVLREELEQAFAEGLDCERVCARQDVQKTFAKGKERVLTELQQNSRYTLIDDAVSRMEWWSCFHPDEEFAFPPLPDEPVITTYRRQTPAVGRNEPCPCGSGRKFKKCCGAA